MQKPLNLEIDFSVNAGYIEYLPRRGAIARTQRVHDAVHADFDADARVLGIELLGFDDEALHAARVFAEQQGLEFPEVLRAISHVESVSVGVGVVSVGPMRAAYEGTSLSGAR